MRRAIIDIRDRIAGMDLQTRVRRGMRPDDVALHARKLRAWRERSKSLTRPKASALWSNKNFAEWGTATINIGVAP